jgi:hypothetical protein
LALKAQIAFNDKAHGDLKEKSRLRRDEQALLNRHATQSLGVR